MENVKCDYCGNEKYDEVIKQTDIYHHTTNEFFSVVRCSKCGLVYTNPRPTKEEIGKYYSQDYDFHSDKSSLKLILLGAIQKIANQPVAKLFTYLPFFNKKLVTYIKPKIDDPVLKLTSSHKTLLDIGCGSGVSAHFWGKEGSLVHYKKYFDVYGIEISDDARKNLSVYGISNYKFIDDVPKEQKFDIIRLNWSLEHVHSPSMFFKFIKEHLNQNGVIMINVPNINGLLYNVSIDSLELPIHLYHFSKKDIENYAEKYGLKVSGFKTFSYPQMYRFLSEQNSSFNKVFNDIKIDEAYYFQKILNRFDNLEVGNDMLIELTHKD